MLQVEVVNLGSFTTAFAEKYPQAVKRGTTEGVHRYADSLAADVRSSIPVKSGKGRASVHSRIVNPTTSAVGYTSSEAFYMRFVDLGAKAHPIYPRGRKGASETKRISRYWRRHPLGATYTGKGKPVPLTRDWTKTPMDRQWSKLTKGGWSGKAAIALPVFGKYFSKVLHPGIKAEHILRSRLDATKDKAGPIIVEAIKVEIQKERA